MDEQIREVFDSYLKPLVEADGGAVEIVEINDGEVVIRLAGNCAGCPGRPYTLEHVIRPVLHKKLGRPIAVVTIDGPIP